MEAIVFWLFALLAIIGAVLLVFHKNPINSALALILTLFSTASIFVLLNAGFIAVLQVLVYAGAIMVLFVFVIMMLNLQKEDLGLRRHAAKKVVAGLLILGLMIKFISVVTSLQTNKAQLADSFGSVENVGSLLFTEYFIPFEAVGLLLLAAVVGAVMVAKRQA